jgi:putative sterol carrier protein
VTLVTTQTSDPTARFFEELAMRMHEPLLRKADARMRFDVVDGGRTRRWLVAIDKGDVTITAGNADATCVIRADKAVFDKLASGRMNAVAAVLRGDLVVAGDPRLLVRMQRLFPGPRASRRGRTTS